ncbi:MULTISPECIES: DUF1120 domain-containing protein [unclassified Pseudomonas]|uniref:DUF1120 domain-containing protein n=2 Tax=Pseudomonas TaxID=286 RepID=UPI00387A9E49
MKKLNALSACALAVLATTSLSALADSVDVKVIGTITPASCKPTLAGGGVVDYGSISPDSLSDTAYTVLPVKTVALSIICDAPAKVALKPVNGRPNSLAGATEGVSGAGYSPVALLGFPLVSAVGLGLDGTSKIGGYALGTETATTTADGVAVDAIQKWDAGGSDTWGLRQKASLIASDYMNTSWAKTGTLVPIAFKTLNAQISVQAYINKKTELDTSKPIALDGLTTLELVYL